MTFQERYNNFKRELLELKTSHSARSAMRTFTRTVQLPEMSSYSGATVRLTYADGTQPIMTTFIGNYALIPMNPSGNTQEFYMAYGEGYEFGAQKVFFLSTRQITNAEVIT